MVHRTWAEKRAEQWLSGRRRQQEEERRRKERRDAARARAQAYAPVQRNRPLVGELVEDVVGVAVDAFRGWRSR